MEMLSMIHRVIS